MKQNRQNLFSSHPQGFALLITLVILVVLSALMAGLSVQLTMAKRRQAYMIEYQRSRYGLDSALKYILTELADQRFTLEKREGKPDFSYLFALDQEAYAQYIADWAATATDEQLDAAMKDGAAMKQVKQVSLAELASKVASLFGTGDSNSIPASNITDANSTPDFSDSGNDEDMYLYELDPNDIAVVGPYGVEWPYVTEPIELEMGPCEITITIEDENAKMPLSWLVTNSKQTNEQAGGSLEVFSEWMGIEKQDVDIIQAQMDEIYKKKIFKVNPSPIVLKKTTTTQSRAKTTRTRSRSTRRTTSRASASTKTVTKTRPATAHTTDFAKLFHSSMLDQDVLKAPRIEAGERVETAKKYLGLWGSQRVNINTAPRHVLEAALMLSTTWSEATSIAEEVIEKRRVAPLKSVDEIKDIGLLDEDTFNKLKPYISTQSTFFLVRVTSRSGNASSSAIATVIKEGKQVEKLAVLYEQ